MIRMIKGNIERIVETDYQKNNLIMLGYSVVDKNHEKPKSVSKKNNKQE